MYAVICTPQKTLKCLLGWYINVKYYYHGDDIGIDHCWYSEVLCCRIDCFVCYCCGIYLRKLCLLRSVDDDEYTDAYEFIVIYSWESSASQEMFAMINKDEAILNMFVLKEMFLHTVYWLL